MNRTSRAERTRRDNRRANILLGIILTVFLALLVWQEARAENMTLIKTVIQSAIKKPCENASILSRRQRPKGYVFWVSCGVNRDARIYQLVLGGRPGAYHQASVVPLPFINHPYNKGGGIPR